jgi:hypothetical protein
MYKHVILRDAPHFTLFGKKLKNISEEKRKRAEELNKGGDCEEKHTSSKRQGV